MNGARKKKDKMQFLALPGSICRQRFRRVIHTMVKVRIEDLTMHRSQDISVFVMYYMYIYVMSGPSLLIEYIDSMIQTVSSPLRTFPIHSPHSIVYGLGKVWPGS